MALIACHECGAKVSTEARVCPSCGVKPKKPGKWPGHAFKLGAAIAVGVLAFKCTSTTQMATGTTPAKPDHQPTTAQLYVSPEAATEIERMRAYERLEFCTAELPKLRSSEAQNPAWAAAVAAIAPEFEVSDAHMDAIKRGTPAIGMSLCGALAVWGQPDDINDTTYNTGTTSQWVYGRGRYMHFRNGYLSSFSQ